MIDWVKKEILLIITGLREEFGKYNALDQAFFIIGLICACFILFNVRPLGEEVLSLAGWILTFMSVAGCLIRKIIYGVTFAIVKASMEAKREEK